MVIPTHSKLTNDDIEDKNSMLCWWPKVEKVDVPKPKTIVLKIKSEIIGSIFSCYFSEGKDREECEKAGNGIQFIASIIDEKVKTDLNGYPVFMRSDYSSCKHSGWKNPLYRINDLFDFKNKIMPFIAECHDISSKPSIFGPPAPHAIAVREWLNIIKWTDVLPSLYGNIEVRVIVSKGKVSNIFPYYHISGLEAHVLKYIENASREKARKDYYNIYVPMVESAAEILGEYAEKIVKDSGLHADDWSVDFALVNKNGKKEWYFIDMALEKDSWKPE